MAGSITVITSKLDLGEFRLPRRFASTGWEIREMCRMIEARISRDAINNQFYRPAHLAIKQIAQWTCENKVIMT